MPPVSEEAHKIVAAAMAARELLRTACLQIRLNGFLWPHK